MEWNGFDIVYTKRRWNVQEDRHHPWHWVNNMGFHVSIRLPLWGEHVVSSISDSSSVVLAPVSATESSGPVPLPWHFYIGLRRHLLQFLPSSWLHTELSKIACHHDHVIITWNGCKSGGRLGWWTRKSWKDSSTFTLLSKVSGSPPHSSEHLLKCIWNIQQEVKCTAIAKYKLQTPPLHHLPACWHEWEVRKCVKTQRKPSAIVLFGLGNSIEKKMPSTPVSDKEGLEKCSGTNLREILARNRLFKPPQIGGRTSPDWRVHCFKV